MGTRRSPAYQKMTNASGNQGEPRSFFTTLHAESRIAKLMTNQSIRPPIPISTTRVPKPLSTPTAGGGGVEESGENFRFLRTPGKAQLYSSNHSDLRRAPRTDYKRSKSITGFAVDPGSTAE